MGVYSRSDDQRVLTYDAHWLRGVKRPVTVTTPAAQSEWTVTVPSSVQWRLIGGSADFTADATVGNRTVGILLQMFGIPIFVNHFTAAIAASATPQIVYQLGTAVTGMTTLITATDTFAQVPFGSFFLPSGSVIQSATAFSGAADQYSDIQLVVEEVLESDMEYTMREWAERDAMYAALTRGE